MRSNKHAYHARFLIIPVSAPNVYKFLPSSPQLAALMITNTKEHEGVLSRGVKVTGATCHFVDEGTDTGPIILQKAVEVKEDDTPEVLQRRVMEQAEWEIMPRAIDLIARGLVTVADGKVRISEK